MHSVSAEMPCLGPCPSGQETGELPLLVLLHLPSFWFPIQQDSLPHGAGSFRQILVLVATAVQDWVLQQTPGTWLDSWGFEPGRDGTVGSTSLPCSPLCLLAQRALPLFDVTIVKQASKAVQDLRCQHNEATSGEELTVHRPIPICPDPRSSLCLIMSVASTILIIDFLTNRKSSSLSPSSAW